MSESKLATFSMIRYSICLFRLEEALTASPGTVHPTVHLVMEHIVRIFKPKMSNTE